MSEPAAEQKEPAVAAGKEQQQGGTEAVEPAAAAQIQRSPFMPGIDSPALSLLSFTQQLRSAEYLAYLAFFIACIIRFNYYISSVGSQLDAMGQTEDATYSTAFGLILPCGLFFNLGLGWALDRYGPVLGLTFVWLLAVLLSALSMVPVLPLQVVTFIVFTLFRGLNFCVMTVFISAVFSFQPLGSLVGMLTAVAGVIGLCNSALLAWALDTPDGVPNFQPVNAFLLAVMLACGLFPIWLARRAGLGSLLSALARGGKPA